MKYLLFLMVGSVTANAAPVCVIDVKETIGYETRWKSRTIFDLGEHGSKLGYQPLATLSESNPPILEEKEYRSDDEIARAKSPSTDWSEDLALSYKFSTENGEAKTFNLDVINSYRSTLEYSIVNRSFNLCSFNQMPTQKQSCRYKYFVVELECTSFADTQSKDEYAFNLRSEWENHAKAVKAKFSAARDQNARLYNVAFKIQENGEDLDWKHSYVEQTDLRFRALGYHAFKVRRFEDTNATRVRISLRKFAKSCRAKVDVEGDRMRGLSLLKFQSDSCEKALAQALDKFDVDFRSVLEEKGVVTPPRY